MKRKLAPLLVCLGMTVALTDAAAAPSAGAKPALAGAAPGVVRAVKVLPDQAPDCTSLKSIAESVTRGCRNNDAKAIAIYNFMQLTHYHRQYPGEPGGLPVLKEIHCYGWSLCGGLHAEQSALWRELGWDWRFVGWNGHTTVEARYDDRWHYLDVFLKFYAWMPDGRGGRTIAGEDDLNDQAQSLIADRFFLDEGRRCVYAKDNPFVMNGTNAHWRAPEFLACGDTLADVVSGLKTHRGRDRAEGWGGIIHATRDYSAEVDLAPGVSLENTWDALPGAWYWAGQKTAPAHTCGGHKDTRNDPGFGLILEPYLNSKPARSYANGLLKFAPDFSNAAFLKSFVRVENAHHTGNRLVPTDPRQPAVLVLRLASPYLLTQGQGEAAGADKVEVSVDSGKTYQVVNVSDFSQVIQGQLAALVRITFQQALHRLRIEATVQNNPGALPYLSPGKNRVTVSIADPPALGENRLVVTYAYRLGSRATSFEQLCEAGKELARQHDAHWAEAVTCVQKSFAAQDLPATFEIDCPTPRNRYPVYPRMVFLRREIVAPGSTPQPLPAGAVEASVSPEDTLMPLPNPFLVGTEPPPVLKTRAVKTTRIPLTYAQYAEETGAVSPQGTLRWPKNRGEDGQVIAGAILVTGDLPSLPARAVAAARLVVPVLQGHVSAAGKLGVVFIPKAVEPGKPCPVKTLGEPAATTIVPKQPADVSEYHPAQLLLLDVTRGLRAVAAGEKKFHGFALRMVPDRGTDEGWTVRCNISPTDPIYLEVDVFSD